MATLLLVDPDQARGHRLRRSLELLGHGVLVGHDVHDVDTRLREGGIDLILVDHFIGGGMLAFADVVRRLPDPVPFVMISSSQSAPTLSARLGAAALLLRPFSEAELVEVIQRIAGMSNLAEIETRRIATVPG